MLVRIAARLRPPVRSVAVCAVILLCSSAARAQTDDVLPNGGTDGLLAEHKKYRELASELIRGLRVADSKDTSHVEALDAQSKYVTYPFTWITVQQKPGEISKFFGGGIESDVRTLLKAGRNAAPAIAIYAPKVIEHALEVLKTRKLIARVNAARVLAKVAELGPPDLSDALVPILNDPDQSDAVKFYILRGLRVLAEQQPPILTPERETKAAEAIVKYINRGMTIADTMTREEVDGYRYIRREAIRALAQFHNPAVAPDGQAAMTLLRVVAKDDLMPPPRVDERVEAAIGVARYKAGLDKYYQPDYAMAQLGLFLDDFNLETTADRQNVAENHASLTLPWKIMASRLYEAIDQMRADAGDDPFIAKVSLQCLKLLEKLEKGLPADATDIVNAIGTKPPANQLFKNIDGSTVKPANRHDIQAVIPPVAPQLTSQEMDAPANGPDGKPLSKPDAKPASPFAPKPDGKPAPNTPPPAKSDAKPAPPPAKSDAKPAPPPAAPPADAKPPAGKQ